MARLLSQHRFPLAVVGAAVALLILSAVALRSSFDSPDAHNALWAPGSVGLVYGSNGRASEGKEAFAHAWDEDVADSLKHGAVIAGKLGNATAKCVPVSSRAWEWLIGPCSRLAELNSVGRPG